VNILGTQTLALGAQRSLYQTQMQTAAATNRLSSGLRVNNAKDDPAGLAIASRMTADIRADATLARGMNDGVSLTQVADAGLGHITQLLQRARELAVQAANGSLQPSDRAALNGEYQQALGQIDQIANSTEVLGIHLLKGQPVAGSTPSLPTLFPTVGTPSLANLFPPGGAHQITQASGIKPIAYIPAGSTHVQIDIDSFGADDDLQLFTQDGRHIAGTPLSDHVWQANGVNTPADVQAKVMLPGLGFSTSATYDASTLLSGDTAYATPGAGPALSASFNGMSIEYSGDGDHADGGANDGSVNGGYTLERVLIDPVNEPILVMVVGSGSFNLRASWDNMPANAFVPPAPPGVGPIDIGLQADTGGDLSTMRIEQAPSDLATLGIGNSDLAAQERASAAMQVLDVALDRVSSYRAQLGANSARLDRSIEQISQASGGLQAARSRVMDADMAQSASTLVSAQIRSNAGQAMLAKSNALPQQVLQLLLDGAKFRGG
jgi:flagellin